MNTKEVLEKIKIHFGTKEISALPYASQFRDFYSQMEGSESKHSTGVYLHSGEEYYSVLSIVYGAISCLIDNNTDFDSLLEILEIGDQLIIDGKRCVFRGLEDVYFGWNDTRKCFVYEDSKGTTKSALTTMQNKSISIYNGDSEHLDGRGIRSDLKERKNFLILTGKPKNISTEINHSFAVIIDRESAEEIYRNTFITFDNKKVHLSDLVTAAYYSDNECYQIGKNPTKEEPIIKFYSRLSACRDDIVSDKAKRIMGCFICNESLWIGNTEIHDIVDRKSLKYTLLSGKFHYTNYKEWLESDEYILHIPTLEYIESHSVSEEIVENSACKKDIVDIKKDLLTLKEDNISSEGKDSFYMEVHALLNLCRTAFFPLSYFDKAVECHLAPSELLQKRLNDLQGKSNLFTGSNYEIADRIVSNISKLVRSIYEINPKAEVVKRLALLRKIDSIVSPKAYYESIFKLWATDNGIHIIPEILTISAFTKSVKTYRNTLFPTPYYDFNFNPYAEFGYLNATILYYPFETYKIKWQKKEIKEVKKLLSAKFGVFNEVDDEIIEVITEEQTYEEELDRLAKKLQLSRAYQYAQSNNFRETDNTIAIRKIVTFASGEVGYLTKQYKAYRLTNNSIEEVDVDKIQIGDSIVFTKEAENKDIVDVLLQQILSKQYAHTEYVKWYQESVTWKTQIKEYMEQHCISYQGFADLLASLDCRKEQVTIRQWLNPDSHIVGPRYKEDYAAIIEVVGINDITADELCKACDEIRKLRTKILGLIAKAILGRFAKGQVSDIEEVIADKVDPLSQIEQITSINEAPEGTRMPMYLINKPCSL